MDKTVELGKTIVDQPGGPNIIPRGLTTGLQRGQREKAKEAVEAERVEDAILLAVRLKEEGKSQRMSTASRSYKRQEMHSSLEPAPDTLV